MMKSSKSSHIQIQRSVDSNLLDRASVDAPKNGRFARTRKSLSQDEMSNKMQIKSDWGARERINKQRFIMSWSILGFALVIAILGVFSIAWMAPKMKSRDKIYFNSNSIPTKSDIITKDVSKFPPPSSKEALDLVKQALAVREPDKVSQYFRLGEASPREVIDFLTGMDARDGQVDRMNWLSSMDTTAIPIEGVLVDFKGRGEKTPRSRMVLLNSDDAGKWRIDYDAFARKVTPTWTDFLEKQAKVATVRVFVQKDIYYNGPFVDEKVWTCYSVRSPDMGETLMAYCKKGSPQALAMAWLFSKEAKIIRAILEIRRLEGAEACQFEISKVLAEDWVMGPTPFDEDFKR